MAEGRGDDWGKSGRRSAAQGRLEAALAADPALSDITLTRILRAAGESVVAEARRDGATVIVKQFLGQDPAARVRALTAELAYLAPRMSAGRAQVNRCLAASPDSGLVVLSHVDGLPMSEALPLAGPADRALILADAGRLVLAYAEGRRGLAAMAPAYWLRRLDRLDADSLLPRDRQMLRALTTHLGAVARALRGAPLARGAVHGDLAPPNLMVRDEGITAFDIQGEALMPLSHDLSRLLAWLAAEPQQPPGPRLLGIAEADLGAVLVPGLPDPEEDPRVLPFFIGMRLAQLVVERREARGRLTAARRAVGEYLDSFG